MNTPKFFLIIILFTFMIILRLSVIAEENGDEIFNEGKKAFQGGDYIHALELFKEASLLKDDNTRYEVYYYIGQAYQKLGKYNEAIETYKEVVLVLDDNDPYEVLSFIGLAECDEKLNMIQECFNHYKEAIIRIPGYEDTKDIIIGQATQAKIDSYKELEKFHPQDPWIQKRLIRLYQDKSQFKEGIVVFKEILKDKKDLF